MSVKDYDLNTMVFLILNQHHMTYMYKTLRLFPHQNGIVLFLGQDCHFSLLLNSLRSHDLLLLSFPTMPPSQPATLVKLHDLRIRHFRANQHDNRVCCHIQRVQLQLAPGMLEEVTQLSDIRRHTTCLHIGITTDDEPILTRNGPRVVPVHINRGRAGAAGITRCDFADTPLGEIVVLAVDDGVACSCPNAMATRVSDFWHWCRCMKDDQVIDDEKLDWIPWLVDWRRERFAQLLLHFIWQLFWDVEWIGPKAVLLCCHDFQKPA